MRKILFMLAVVTVAGCAGPKIEWGHPTNGKQQFYADSAACEAVGGQAYPYHVMSQQEFWWGPLASDENNPRRDVEMRCMMGKGYRAFLIRRTEENLSAPDGISQKDKFETRSKCEDAADRNDVKFVECMKEAGWR